MTKPGFIHLHVHSAYSLLEGALPVKALIKAAAADNQPALAITDRNNLFGALEFSEYMAGEGIQPIIGCALTLAFPAPADETPRPGARPAANTGTVVVLAKDAEGYGNLMRLSSQAFLDSGDGSKPHVELDFLAEHARGLIALSGGPDGPADRAFAAGNAAVAEARLAALAESFGDRFYVEIQRHGLARERAVEPQLLRWAYDNGVPLVATNEAYFPKRAVFEAHDALLCIAEGRYVAEDDRRRLSPDHWLKPQADMVKLFADLPEAVANTIEIAQRCAFRPRPRKPILPQFVIGSEDTHEAEAAELRKQAQEGLARRLAVIPENQRAASVEDYEKRLEFELDVITRMKFPGYFLIVSDFIKWAKAHGIPVGPGRGSGAGSVVAWSLTITDLDPIRFGLLFERFLNPERVSMPDFDIDFCQDRRDEVIQYVRGKYGANRVAQIITYGKLQARAVLRDVGRVLQMPYGQVDRLCKLVPNNPANPVTLAEAIEGEPKLQEARDGEEIVAQLLDTAQKLEGLYRHASTHAAGVVIGDRDLVELVPLYRDPKSDMLVTQFNMKWVEQAGLVKFDFLGLKTLTVLQKACALLEKAGRPIDLGHLPLDDRPTYEMLAKGDTGGVFQLESTGMREALRKLKPDRFGDIIAMVALYRPGPMDNIETYVNRKHGIEVPDYLHPLAQPILEETYGVIIYQEQVMQLAQVLSGYSLGEADLLRRAMGKKIKAEMDAQGARFVKGALEKDIPEARARYIFELVAKFAGYGFNKSHAAAYALIAYQTAYLKANHPQEFIAASMTLDMANTDKLYGFTREARQNGLAILPPSVNRSAVEFEPEGDDAIRYALAALKNMGHAAAAHIVEERGDRPFLDLADFMLRINPKAVNKRAIETLNAAGAFSDMEPNRAKVAKNLDRLVEFGAKAAEDRARGQVDMFGGGIAGGPAPRLDLAEAPEWSLVEKLENELGAAGFYLSGHPLDDFTDQLARMNVLKWSDFSARVQAHGRAESRLAATVTYRQDRKAKSGNRFAFAGFSDPTGQFEAVIFSDTLNVAGDKLEAGKNVLVHVEGEADGEAIKVRVQAVQALDDVLGKTTKQLSITATERLQVAELVKHLGREGGIQVNLVVQIPEAQKAVEFKLGDNFSISARQLATLKTLPGVLQVG
ncbi:DNA polymerase III subunit alpha [Rhodomicrobium lacus]|uniref:DNA polymerase III subunit alpha n=1 Tax=Rhodomicrobium lacus TaxID=2498452 RepID=UPI0026E433FE|nr:DNA polymerase III subunit alpha [Rhodomicrobium lacus]WKW50552.1 DNA polymerase III subunit alpha [Rhodomicrobium lacus]